MIRLISAPIIISTCELMWIILLHSIIFYQLFPGWTNNKMAPGKWMFHFQGFDNAWKTTKGTINWQENIIYPFIMKVALFCLFNVEKELGSKIMMILTKLLFLYNLYIHFDVSKNQKLHINPFIFYI